MAPVDDPVRPAVGTRLPGVSVPEVAVRQSVARLSSRPRHAAGPARGTLPAVTGSDKNFKLEASEIESLAPGHGACIATDKIVVDGERVRFMYREAPDNDIDSGWRFMAGSESQEYMDDAANHAIYDVNTVANYDPDIIPFLEAPVGSAFERHSSDDDFVEVDDFELPDD